MISKIKSAIRNTREKMQGPGGSRYERKFVLNLLDINQLESIIKHHPAFFKQIYQKRQVNNIYLDTHDLKTYFDNVYGNTNRVKVRIRWYGNTFGSIESPKLELKIKSGLAGNKYSYLLQSFVLDKSFSQDIILKIFNDSDLPGWVREKLANYRPALLNSYVRKYFVSEDRNVRITLDTDMTYYAIASRNNNFLKHHVDRKSVILEMKYDLDSAFIASELSQGLPMRMTKSSKFVNGIELFNTHLST